MQIDVYTDNKLGNMLGIVVEMKLTCKKHHERITMKTTQLVRLA